ncbi:NAD-dependent epimerase/dehydratase family protein [Thioalkalivibrio sp. XN279]|uniref:NAD-dependent epimerase/dehydratase family protein n=1 Tax=Thioalkalivibrio sp. XN279 TaxID=2714953 RepID=UPI001409CE7A|nr:NAD-dependent epimerase/dehydratase family protein [Thioalkalivibrio sp. XN279]NHA13766.1 NAD-dependent epimerase/dehydratase family protein [Thioalkalivibrio sp. XN279]
MTHPEHPAAVQAGLTVVGCGYTGRRLLKLCREPGRDVVGTARGDDSLAQIRALGGRALRLDLDLPAARLPRDCCAGRALVYMTPPPQAGADDPRLRNFLSALPALPASLVYLSTTAVYGDTGGALVTEETPAAPASERGARRLDAERAALQWGEATGVPVRILRVPGIYGPGRLPTDRIRQGAPVVRAEDAGPGNRIHVDDLAAACLAAVDYPGAQRIFNVGDGDHASTTEYFRAVADAAGLAPPPELPLQDLLARVSPAMRGFLVESRRVDTTRMRTELGFIPRYDSLAAGVAASLTQDRS